MFLSIDLWRSRPPPCSRRGAGAAAQTAAQGALLERALDAAAAGDWHGGRDAGAAHRQQGRGRPVTWVRLRDGAGDWDDQRALPSCTPTGRGSTAMRRSAERADAVRARTPRRSSRSSRRRAAPDRHRFAAAGGGAEGEKAGAPADADAEIVRAWTTFSMSQGERQPAMVEGWREVLKPHHQERLDMLLWRGLTNEAEAMLRLVDEDWQKLAQARIAARRDAAGMQYLIDSRAGAARRPSGARLRALPLPGGEEGALAGGGGLSAREVHLGRRARQAGLWMERRANLARQALEDGDSRRAYRIAARNFGSEGRGLCRRRVGRGFHRADENGRPDAAIGHFTRFQAAVATPISLGRAGYWLGLAEEAPATRRRRAAFAWARGTRRASTASSPPSEAGGPADPRLAGGPAGPDWRKARFMRHVGGAGRLLAAPRRRRRRGHRSSSGTRPRASRPETRAALAQMAIDLGRPQVGIRIGKDAAADGMVLPDQYYPLHLMAGTEWPVATEFVMAVARQESSSTAGGASTPARAG